MKAHFWIIAIAAFGLCLDASAYPGGTASFQTDVAPFCAGCHSSRDAEMMEGGGERAQKEVAERKHIAMILAGQKGYSKLTETDRLTLASQVRALDEASTVKINAPTHVVAGATFHVTVSVTGGAGPVVGIALVDRAHRWYARPASSAGWSVTAPPKVVGQDGRQQTGWLSKRPEAAGHNLSYVNISGIASDASTQSWATASVTFTLRAPLTPGAYPLGAVYLYGTEKSTVLGYTTNPMGWKEVRGGLGGGSGRVLFSDVNEIEVVAPPAPSAAPTETPEGADSPDDGKTLEDPANSLSS